MNLHLRDSNFELSSTLIMANLDLDPKAPLDAEAIQAQLREFEETGATFVEFSVAQYQEHDFPSETEVSLLCAALDAAKDSLLIPAVFTSDPKVMEQAAQHGVEIIVDPLALRAPNAMEVVAKYGLVVLMCFDQTVTFEEDKDDPCAAVSEFFYERLDACINAKIDRQKIILDPMIGVNSSVDFRLKMFGRLKTFNSFGLPLSCELPRLIADTWQDLDQRMSIMSAVALFAEQQGVRLIRTRRVYDIALTINTWHQLHLSARPFKLSRAIGSRLKKAIAKRREQHQH